ncbi:hypothetical protein LSH36_1186g02016 [Paralvinella palmiformis]|uniref:Uncharacterized protein n=1 Tax=Paralvinella palmiformis TaxID=53620 RepID=A0AAD9IUW3_9ANNE|nr:hypothetical protein LSH36_1186g02016 [Paralvinella palmiformis]
MLRSRSSVHRRTRSDIVDRRSKIDVSPSPEGQYSEGQLELDCSRFRRSPLEERSSGGFVVRRQMKQVVGDLVTVLGELRTVVGDIRTLVSQIDIVTHKIDQSVSSDQSDRSARSANPKIGTRSTTSSGSRDQQTTSLEESTNQAVDFTHVGSRMGVNVCDLSCFGNQQNKDKPVKMAAPLTSANCTGERQGERLSNHDRLYVAYRPQFSRHSIDKCPFPAAKRAPGYPLAGEKEYGKENVSRPKAPQTKSTAYFTHIYENIKAFRKKTSPDGHKRVSPSIRSQDQNGSIPNRRSRCFYASATSPNSTRTQLNRETAHVLKTQNNNMSSLLHKAKTKTQQEYSGLYEREMEEKLELEFDESLDLLDTLAEIQTVDNDFEQAYDDYDPVTPARDSYPIDMIRKHADVVAWAQSAWPAARCTGNSLDCSDPGTEDDSDSEWYQEPASNSKSANGHFVNFSWRPVIEP